MICQVCGGTSKRLFQKYAYWICECTQCKHRFCDFEPSPDHVDRVYSDAYFFEGKDGYPNYLGEENLLIAHGERYGRLLARYMKPGRVLDIGAAAGFILKGLQSTGWQGVGIEPNARMAAYAAECLGLDVRAGSLEQCEVNETFDLVTMIQVIGHFYDLESALVKAARVTRPGGYWLIESWNKDSLVAQLFGKNWHEYSPHSVLRWFGPADLNRAAAKFGFVPIARGRPNKQINLDHIESLLSYKLSHPAVKTIVSRAFGLFPKHMTVPYPSFDLFWVLYQKSA